MEITSRMSLGQKAVSAADLDSVFTIGPLYLATTPSCCGRVKLSVAVVNAGRCGNRAHIKARVALVEAVSDQGPASCRAAAGSFARSRAAAPALWPPAPYIARSSALRGK